MIKKYLDDHYSHSREKPQNLKVMKFKFLDFQSMVQISKFQKSFTTCKCGVTYMTYTTKCKL